MPHETKKKGYKGRKERVKHLSKLNPVYVVEILTRNTTPQRVTVDPKWAKSKVVREHMRPRSAGENAKIINAQAKAGRKFAFVDHREFKKMQVKLRKKLNAFEQGAPERVIVKGVKGIGDAIAEAFRENLRNEKSPRRPFRKLKKGYRTHKESIYGDQPIMQRTGQLLHSLIVRQRKQ